MDGKAYRHVADHHPEPRFAERRSHRSDVCLEALALQLEHVKEDLSLEAMVLCDDFGEVVVAAGNMRIVDGLSEQLPWLIAAAPWQLEDSLTYLREVYPDLDSGSIALRTIPTRTKHEPLILCGVGQAQELEEGVDHTLKGVHRIIRTTLN